MTVGAVLVPSVTISASPSTTICSGTSVTFTPSPLNGGGSPTYEWFLNSVSQGISATFISASLNNGDVIDAIMTSSLVCATPTTASSNIETMTVTPSVVPTIVASAVPKQIYVQVEWILQVQSAMVVRVQVISGSAMEVIF